MSSDVSGRVMWRASDGIHIADPREAAFLQEGVEGYEACGCWILASVSPLQEEKLGELIPLASKYPRVLFVLSLRTELARRFPIPTGYSRININNSDVSLKDLFFLYCEINTITCPPSLRWTLTTPLAIKLFADLYREKSIHEATFKDLSLANLMKKKIDYAEKSIRESDPVGWPNTISPVRKILRSITQSCITLDQPVLLNEAVEEVKSNLNGILSAEKILHIIERCENQGLLLRVNKKPEDPLDEDIIYWEPAYQALTDYLLAREAYNLVKENPNEPILPNFLRNRGNAIILTIHLLGEDGINFIESGLWQNSIDQSKREQLQLIALTMMPSQMAETFKEWVKRYFATSMPNCRKVLRNLIIPGLRVQNSIFGGTFIYDVLSPLGVAERDIFWSCPNEIPPNYGAPWEGRGDSTLEDICLEEDDPWDTAPLLLAWVFTTINNENRRRLRSELAGWGSINPEGLYKLISTTISTNDPQMLEDIVSSAFGAACLVTVDDQWIPLCDLMYESFYSQDPTCPTDDVIVRHCTRGIIERASSCGVNLPMDYIHAIRNRFVDTGKFLRLNRQASLDVDDHHGISPATGDLAWYVVKKLIESFDGWSRTSSNDPPRDPSFLDVDNDIIQGVIEQRLRKSIPKENRDEIAEAHHLIQSVRSASTNEEIEEIYRAYGLLEEGKVDDPDRSVDNGDTAPATNESLTVETPSQLKCMLCSYGILHGIQELSFWQLVFGYIIAFVEHLGWDEQLFIGTPNGGEPDEILGADVAIIRKYSRATHGARSKVSSFGEKYVWLAINQLYGYFADRLQAYEFNSVYDPPVDYSLLAEPTNPASDILRIEDGWGQLVDFPGLTPDISINSMTQEEISIEWIRSAPLPEINHLILPKGDQLPSIAQGIEWITLWSNTTRKHDDCQTDTTVWVSSFLFPSKYRLILKEDAGVRPLFQNQHESKAEIASVEFYRDPCEILWAPWIEEKYHTMSYHTLDEVGNLIEIE